MCLRTDQESCSKLTTNYPSNSLFSLWKRKRACWVTEKRSQFLTEDIQCQMKRFSLYPERLIVWDEGWKFKTHDERELDKCFKDAHFMWSVFPVEHNTNTLHLSQWYTYVYNKYITSETLNKKETSWTTLVFSFQQLRSN